MPPGDAMGKHDRPPMEELRRTLRRLQDGHHLIDLDELGHSAEELAGLMIGLSWATGEFGRSAMPRIVYDALEAELTVPSQGVSKFTFPADTPFLGVVWEDWAWDLVKSGQLRGYSIGGTAKRVEADLPVEATI